jgi:uncharacterized phiE125 gp8 family phage protein
MALIQINRPQVAPVTLEEARAHCRLDAAGSPPEHPDDALLSALIDAATQYIDGPNGILSRSIVSQKWELVIDGFPSGAVEIPLPPLQSVETITYLDSEGNNIELDESGYSVDNARQPGFVVPGADGWPQTGDYINAVRIRFVSGYAPEGSPPDYRAGVPQAIKQAILLLVGHWYENREDVVVGTVVNKLPTAAEALLFNYRVWA